LPQFCRSFSVVLPKAKGYDSIREVMELKKVFLIFAACLRSVTLAACSSGAIKQKIASMKQEESSASAAVQGNTASGNDTSVTGTQKGLQNQELQDILSNLNSMGNSANSMDQVPSSNLNIPTP
jgi:outer membrane murein-binding lipoprotein Lpp